MDNNKFRKVLVTPIDPPITWEGKTFTCTLGYGKNEVRVCLDDSEVDILIKDLQAYKASK